MNQDIRGIDTDIALALGWTDLIVSDDTGRLRLPINVWKEQNPEAWPIYLTGRSPEMPGWPSSVVPHYADDIDWLEDEVERRGLEDDYIRALLSIVIPDGSSVLAFWKIRRATPDQCAQAFLQAVRLRI